MLCDVTERSEFDVRRPLGNARRPQLFLDVHLTAFPVMQSCGVVYLRPVEFQSGDLEEVSIPVRAHQSDAVALAKRLARREAGGGTVGAAWIMLRSGLDNIGSCFRAKGWPVLWIALQGAGCHGM